MAESRHPLLLVAELAESGLAAAALVHEMRQPLFAIKGMLQQGAASGGLDAAAVGELLEAVERIERLVDGWRHVGRQEPEGTYDLRMVAEDVLGMVRPETRRAQVTVMTEPSGPWWVWGRPEVGRQVLLNLVRNAVDAVRPCAERRVVIRFLEEDGLAGVEVEDSGPGLDAAMRERAFQPFVTTKGRRGTGLGLYVSRSLCESEGGHLTLGPGDVGTRARALFAQTGDQLLASNGPMKKA